MNYSFILLRWALTLLLTGFLQVLSRVAVSAVLSLSANGIFAIGSKFGSTVALATTCFTLAWQDVAFTSEIKPASFYSRAISQYTGFLLSSTAVLLPMISLVFPILVGSSYSTAYSVVPSFLWVAVASVGLYFHWKHFYVIKDTKTIGVIDGHFLYREWHSRISLN